MTWNLKLCFAQVHVVAVAVSEVVLPLNTWEFEVLVLKRRAPQAPRCLILQAFVTWQHLEERRRRRYAKSLTAAEHQAV